MKTDTTTLTTCNGKIDSNGRCNKCFEVSQITSAYCTRLIEEPIHKPEQKHRVTHEEAMQDDFQVPLGFLPTDKPEEKTMEDVFVENAKENMIQFNIAFFKRDYPTLLRIIILSMRQWEQITNKERDAEIERLKGLITGLQHYKDTTVGLWATDRPDMIIDEQKIMFQL